ncbi:thiamine-phosphate kinase [Algimonas porphyrae]|uniref:thiamine-phosphate kinase n=1 Tax=Algimonas porphyrae TaxID=1128113 RepID=UPI0024E1462C|nr:thiamine-phosphate kinase [Algimonas porphyrae]
MNDDAALLSAPVGHDLVLSVDTMVEGVHFPKGRIGGDFSERLLRTALSDLAAKGARPIGYMLAVAWPSGRYDKWAAAFISGLHDAQRSFDCPLLGGDTTATKGPLVASANVYGVVPTGEMVTRSGAKTGDHVWYTGVLGRAETGLKVVMGDPDVRLLSGEDRLACEEAYLRPEPRFLFRKTLRQVATACADISDGLYSEAGHIAEASGVHLAMDYIRHADFGDDYELLLTAPPSAEAAIRSGADAIGLPVTRCGHVVPGEGISIDGEPVQGKGYRHTF